MMCLQDLKKIFVADKTTLDGIKCTTRRYTIFYLTVFFVLINVLRYVTISLFPITRLVTIGSGYQFLLLSFVSGLLACLLYLYQIDIIQEQLTSTIRSLIVSIRSLKPEAPGELLVVNALRCDDELQEVVTTLNTKSEQIQHHIDYLKKLIGYIQHEFNTPLAIAQLQLDQLIKKTNVHQHDVRGIQDELSHMGGLVNSIVSLMQAEAEEFALEPVNINEVATAISGQLQEIYPFAQVTIFGEEKILSHTSKQYVRAVLRNILENAVKHGSDTIHVSIDQYRMTIKDNGAGIAASDMDYVWLPFWKKEVRGESVGGFGLGLSLVKVLIKRLQRTINVESDTTGTTFILTFCV